MRKVSLIAILSFLLAFSLTSVSNAEYMKDIGRTRGTFLEDYNQKKEMNVTSVQITYDKISSTLVKGRIHIRAWGRLENLRKIYPPEFFYTTAIYGADFRLYSDDVRRANFSAYGDGSNPPNKDYSHEIPAIFEDILGATKMSSTIKTWANQFMVNKVWVEGSGYDVVKRIKWSQSSKASLPNKIPHYKADINNFNMVTKAATKSGVAAVIPWDFNASNPTGFKIWPMARIYYKIQYTTHTPVYKYTRYTGIHYKINT